MEFNGSNFQTHRSVLYRLIKTVKTKSDDTKCDITCSAKVKQSDTANGELAMTKRMTALSKS